MRSAGPAREEVLVLDGPDPGPRRSRRTRADDRSAGPDGDDVLDRFGLRTSDADDTPHDRGDGPRSRRQRAGTNGHETPAGRRRATGGDGPRADRDGSVEPRSAAPVDEHPPTRRRRAAPDAGTGGHRQGGAGGAPGAIAADRTSAIPPIPPIPQDTRADGDAATRTSRRGPDRQRPPGQGPDPVSRPVRDPARTAGPAPDRAHPTDRGRTAGRAPDQARPPERAPGRGPRRAGPSAPAEAGTAGVPVVPPDGPADDDGAGSGPDGRRRRVLRIGAAVVAVLVFAACASGFVSYRTISAGVGTVSALDTESDAISNRSTQTGDQNILVMGLPPNRTATPEAERSDTAVLVHLPAGGGQALTLGIPSTLEVPRPPCQRWDPAAGGYGETVPAESRTAFSAAFDVGGPRCSVEVVQQLTGLVVTRFVAMDMGGTAALVNAVRGVGVCTERPVVDQALGPVVPRPGDTVLGGTEAERFVAAHGVDDVSPVDRVRRQQRVLSAVLDRALSTPSLLTPGAADRVARALPAAVMTDGADANELLVLSGSLARTTGEGAAPTYLTVPVGAQPNTRGHLELQRSDATELFSAMRKHEPLPAETLEQARLAATTALPAGTVVDVLNAAGRPGVAGEAAGALRAHGYLVGAVQDTDPAPDSVVRFSPDRAAAAQVVAASVPGSRPEAQPDGSGRLELVLGASFPGPAAITAPPRPEGSTVDCG